MMASETPDVLPGEVPNGRYPITALFHGSRVAAGSPGAPSLTVVQSVSFRNLRDGTVHPYVLKDDLDQAADLYFTNLWSSDGERAALPLGKRKGFAVFTTRSLLTDMDARTFPVKVAVNSRNSGAFFHTFGEWEGPDVFGFRAGLEGDMFAYTYNAATGSVTCYHEGCARSEAAEGLAGPLPLIEAPKPWPVHRRTTMVR